MEVLVVADSHFYKDSDGSYWAKSIYSYNFWERYLLVFDKVAVVSRTQSVESVDTSKYLRVDGPNVRIIELPFLRGMKDYLKSYFQLRNAAKKAVNEAGVAIFRVPSVVATLVLNQYKKTGNPYSLEVVVDPYDAYQSNKLAQIYYTYRLKRDAIDANGVSYVTKYYLQQKYPSGATILGESHEKFETYYSTIDLRESYFGKPRKYNSKKRKYIIVHTANSINNDTKGHLTVLEIVKKLKEKSVNVEAVFIGDGDKREYYEKKSVEYNIADSVKFLGSFPTSDEVREVLLKSDLFVFPSKAEGLPRALIEAMAVGLPCLSTPVNGIPELLSDKYLYHPSDVDGFTEKLIELINNPTELNKMSEENISNAKKYTIDKLSTRRNEFYMKLKRISK